jgi:site-specific DNA-adenine methylase
MKATKTKIQSYGKIHGGKNRYARQYLAVMDAIGCVHYCEPFCGGAGVGMNADASQFETMTLNDLDTNVFRTLQALASSGEKVVARLKKKTYNPEVFDESLRDIGHNDPVRHAAAYIVRNRFSSGGRFERFAKTDVNVRLRGGRMGDENAWINFITKHIHETIIKVRHFDLFSVDGTGLVRKGVPGLAPSKTLHFVDPPYLNSTLVTPNAYEVKFTEKDHAALLDACVKSSSRIYLCGYSSEMYEQKLVAENGWSRVMFDRAADSGRTKTKSRRTECLWTNHRFL